MYLGDGAIRVNEHTARRDQTYITTSGETSMHQLKETDSNNRICECLWTLYYMHFDFDFNMV